MTVSTYNTRRKSLSLPSLGISLPKDSSRAHRSNPKSTSPPSHVLPIHSAKRVKRAHSDDEPSSPFSPSRKSSNATESQTAARRPIAHTPPPSPGDVSIVRKIDTDGINDDIVIAVIEQLEKTGNRPHLIKDLATVLASTNASIANSANPAALLSSRLSLYLKRQWTALSPCPIAKELIPVHPRKVFFYLTNQPRMPLPETSDDIIAPEIKRLTPSISDPSVSGEDADHDRRRMSPSPEIELYSPDLDHSSPITIAPSTPADSFQSRASSHDTAPHRVRRSHRAPSPPLEADEKGFTETATAVRARGMSLNPRPLIQPSIEEKPLEVEMSAEMRQRRDQELLFGPAVSNPSLMVIEQKIIASSPMILAKSQAPKLMLDPVHIDDIEMEDAPWNLMSPETIDPEELDVLFSDF